MSVNTATAPAPQLTRTNRPVTYWATAGGLWLVFMIWIGLKWITGPHFRNVPYGPSEPSDAMKLGLTLLQTIPLLVMLGLMGWFLIRPLIRERQLTTDGILTVCCLTMWFQDPFSCSYQHWFTFNTYLFNRGSWANELPFFHAYGEPGAELTEPILFQIGVYGSMFMIMALRGSWFMRICHQRWPRLSNLQLLMICYVTQFVADCLFEGPFFRLGAYTAPGMHLKVLWADKYYAFPLMEPIFAAVWATGLSAIRYFKNDRGESLPERGLSEIVGSPAKRTAMRILAILAACHACFFFLYNVPVTLILGTTAEAWPADLQQRSYLTEHVCGAGTDRACPGPDVPVTRGNNSIHIDPNGKLVIPRGAVVPTLVPFENGSHAK